MIFYRQSSFANGVNGINPLSNTFLINVFITLHQLVSSVVCLAGAQRYHDPLYVTMFPQFSEHVVSSLYAVVICSICAIVFFSAPSYLSPEADFISSASMHAAINGNASGCWSHLFGSSWIGTCSDGVEGHYYILTQRERTTGFVAF